MSSLNFIDYISNIDVTNPQIIMIVVAMVLISSIVCIIKKFVKTAVALIALAIIISYIFPDAFTPEGFSKVIELITNSPFIKSVTEALN